MEERKIAEAQIESFCQYLIREEKSAVNRTSKNGQ